MTSALRGQLQCDFSGELPRSQLCLRNGMLLSGAVCQQSCKCPPQPLCVRPIWQVQIRSTAASFWVEALCKFYGFRIMSVKGSPSAHLCTIQRLPQYLSWLHFPCLPTDRPKQVVLVSSLSEAALKRARQATDSSLALGILLQRSECVSQGHLFLSSTKGGCL